MNTEQVLEGMGWIHDIILEMVWGNEYDVDLLACNWDKLKTTSSKMYPVTCAVINNVLSENTVKSIERWGFSDTPTRDSIYEDCERKKSKVIAILENYKGN